MGYGGQTNAIAWANTARSKDSFSFSFSEFVVRLDWAICGYQKGLAGFEINRKIFHT